MTTAQIKLEKAIACHQQGQFAQAKAIYENILKTKPRHADALHLLGLIMINEKNYQRAVQLIGKAINSNPQVAAFYSNRGLAQQELKQLEAAVASYDRAIALNPGYATAYSNRGFALHELKQFEAAIASYDHAIAIDPNYATAYSNRGNALQELKQLEQAIENFDRAISIKPDYAQAHYNRGNALKELERFEEAIESFDRAIAILPDFAGAYLNRGLVLTELNQWEAALNSYDTAIAIKPDYADAYVNRGNLLQHLKHLEAAIENYNDAINIKPDCAQAFCNQGNAYQSLGQFEKAVESYERAFTLAPNHEYLLGMLIHANMHLCDWSCFAENVSELVKRIERNEKCSYRFSLLSLSNSSSLQRALSVMVANDKYPYNHSLGNIPTHPKTIRIRVGYFSADFRDHAVSMLLAELFEVHDKNHFEIFVFSFGPVTQDVLRMRIEKAADHFIDVQNQSDKSIALLAREMKIDIAIDLGGDTGGARPGIFMYRAAPIQVNYLGWPGTMGADYFDYVIADRIIIPAESQPHYVEKVVYLPNSYQPNDTKRKIADKVFSRAELGLPEDGFIFCCFNNNHKITPDVFDGWMRILKAVNGSVLFLYASNKTAEANLKKEAIARGIEPDRLIFGGRLEPSEYLARYKVADLFLNTFPYDAGTTGSDALWAGLPLLTRVGETFVSRVAASLLNAIGLPELITTTQEDYEALAIELATHPAKLKAIKEKLATNRLTTPLFNTTLFAKHIENAYTQMVERYQAGLAPDHIYIKNPSG